MKEMKRKKTACEESEQHVPVCNEKKKRKKSEVSVEADTNYIKKSCVNDETKGRKKKLQTEDKTQKAEDCIAVSEDKKKKKKKIAKLEDTDPISFTESCVKEVLDGNNEELQMETETQETRKKKKKKKKDADARDISGIVESCLNEEESEKCVARDEVKKKKKKKEFSVDTGDLTESGVNKELNGKKTEIQKLQATETEEGGEAEERMNADSELSPEEKRVLERKLKKILKKEQKQKMEAKSKDEESKTNVAQTQALEYLTCWSKKRDEWKFQKTRQVWLLQHMYDNEKVPDSHFSILLEYIEGLRGVARETTVQKAEALVRFGGGQEEKEDGATDAQTRTNRAREVIQMLS
ncbi:uncharacterized protein C7orf50 homolog [Trichomycterus rosablanca]|uniref:uncharacterized protein C7orf50 homolog n=1 Tax=Trichomycterus rosablanca TaxID=2290929 RepID=UPI002F357FF2